MNVAICLIMCGIVKHSHAEYHVSDGASDKLFDVLIARIDTLEEKLEARERIHDMEMTKQTNRINALEVTIRRQEDRLNELLNRPGDSPLNDTPLDDALSNDTPPRNAPAYRDREIASWSKNRSVQFGSRIRQAERPAGVAFFAKLSFDLTHIGTNQTIAFDNVVTNIGNGYNPHVGVFIAPLAGTYVFSVTLVTYERHVTHYAVFRNSEWITNLFINGFENSYDSTTQMVVLHLAKGDDVKIKYRDSDQTLRGSYYSVFSGFLLRGSGTDASPTLVGK